ncbi:MAG: tetratricopeptide repeat protein [Gemmatimonadota bacterium]|nr:tetratricopeptide repeat protein [Gemmatimonadota bacterium]MDH3424235.1 tetratricopeptide repeat protein [Gemmatimonadota bacterium]
MAKRHPDARRTPKHGKGDEEDAFVASVLDVTNWAKGNQQVLTVAGVVVAILVAGGLYYNSYKGQLNDQAAESLETIYQSVAISDIEGAKTDLATFLSRFAGTVYESEARLLLGELYLESNESQQALAVLGPLGSSPRAAIEFQAAALLGAAYEQEERWAEAEETYLTIADRSDLDFQVRNALAAAARIRHEHRNDPQGAIELYEEVLAQLDANAPERGRYEMRIQEIRSAANI